MRKSWTILLILPFLAGCDEIPGTVEVIKETTLKFESIGNLALQPGSYPIELGVSESRHQIEVEFQKVDGKKDRSAIFKFNKGHSLPTENGDFEILSSESGQPVDLVGSVTTTTTIGEPYRATEPCQEQVRRETCSADASGRVYCRIDYVYEQGERDIEARDVSKTKVIAVDMTTAGLPSDALGKLSAESTETWRDYIYEGYCRTYWR